MDRSALPRPLLVDPGLAWNPEFAARRRLRRRGRSLAKKHIGGGISNSGILTIINGTIISNHAAAGGVASSSLVAQSSSPTAPSAGTQRPFGGGS